MAAHELQEASSVSFRAGFVAVLMMAFAAAPASAQRAGSCQSGDGVCLEKALGMMSIMPLSGGTRGISAPASATPGRSTLSGSCHTGRGACPIYPQKIGSSCRCSDETGLVGP